MLSIGSPLRILWVGMLLEGQACAPRDILLGTPVIMPAAAGRDTAGVSAGAAGTVDLGVTAGMFGLPEAAAGNGSAGAGAGAAGEPGTNSQGGRGADAGAGGSASLRPSAGCGRDPLPGDTSIQVSNMRANYLLDLPSGYDKTRAYPLVMAFRGAGNTADAFRGTLGLTAVTDSEAIVVYPNCLNDASAWEVQRDLALVEALLPKLGAAYCIDQDRVFAVGHGAGALFVNALGCIHGDELRGMAPLSGAPRPAGACTSTTAVWLLQSSTDTTLGTGLGNRDFWVQQNACDSNSAAPVSPAPCVEYSGCDIRYPVRYCQHEDDSALPGFVASGVWDFFRGL